MKTTLIYCLLATLVSGSALADQGIRCVSGHDHEFGWEEQSLLNFQSLKEKSPPCVTNAFYGDACFLGKAQDSAELLASKNFSRVLESKKYEHVISPFFAQKDGYYLRNITAVHADVKDGYAYDMIVFMAHEIDVQGRKVDKAVVLKRCRD